MNSSKHPIRPDRVRSLPAQFSWVDQRLVREYHFANIDSAGAALYLFLVTVADAQGLSWYGDAAIARQLGIDLPQLHQIRRHLAECDLIAFANGIYQVLSLTPRAQLRAHEPSTRLANTQSAPPSPGSSVPAMSPPAAVGMRTEPVLARHYLADLHALLTQRS